MTMKKLGVLLPFWRRDMLSTAAAALALALAAGLAPAAQAGNREARAAAADARAQERSHIQQQRQAINATLQQAQTACYQRFAVEDCLERERRRARQATAPLAKREAALDEAERRERAAQRLNDIAERQPAAPAPASPARVRRSDAAASAAPDVLQQERDFEAHERALRLQQKQQRHVAEQAGQIAQRAAAAEKARQRLEEKRQAAERRRARALQEQQQRAASGRKPPAALDPLP